MRPVPVLVLFLAAAATAAAGPPKDLPANDVFDSAGKFSALGAGTYEASSFPLSLRITVPGAWSGAQWKANGWSPQEIARRHLKCPRVCQPPYYG